MEPNDFPQQPPQKRPREACALEKAQEKPTATLDPPNIFTDDLPQWLFDKCEFDLSLVVNLLDVISKNEMLGEEKDVEGAKWGLRFRRVNQEDRTFSYTAHLVCKPDSTAWRADCAVDFSIETVENYYHKFEGELPTKPAGMELQFQTFMSFIHGVTLKAKVTIKRINSSFLSFPVFDNPKETGADRIIVDGRTLFVNKEILSVYSDVLKEYFRAQPNGPVVLPDTFTVVDVICALRTIYPQNGVVDGKCQTYLTSGDCKLRLLEKFNIAVECDMSLLQKQYQAEFTPVILKTEMHKEGDKLSLGTKTNAALFDLIMELQNNEN